MTNPNIAIAHIVQVNWTTMKKFVHVLNVEVVYIGTEIFGNAQIVTIRKKIKIRSSSSNAIWCNYHFRSPFKIIQIAGNRINI